MKTPTGMLLALAAAASLGAAYAADDTVYITEYSSESLTAIYHGAPLAVKLLGDNQWLITPPVTISSSGDVAGWTEIEGTSYNDLSQVAGTSPETSQWIVTSDVPFSDLPPIVQNGDTISDDLGNGASIRVELSDVGDAAESESTALLLLVAAPAILAAAGLRGPRAVRLRSLRCR